MRSTALLGCLRNNKKKHRTARIIKGDVVQLLMTHILMLHPGHVRMWVTANQVGSATAKGRDEDSTAPSSSSGSLGL